MNNRNLPDLYYDLRNKMGLSQTELANKLNCNKQLISKFESGERRLSMTMLIAYADFFNVSTDYLLGLQKEPTNDPNVIAATEYTGLTKEAAESLNKYYSRLKSSNFPKYVDGGLCNAETFDIINELISNGDMYTLAEHLSKLKYDSQEYFEYIEIFKNMQLSREVNGNDDRSEAEKKGEDIRKKREIDNIEERIKINKYELNEFIIHLSDRYDQREQVKNNGNRNKKNK